MERFLGGATPLEPAEPVGDKYGETWSIGIYTGESPLTLSPPTHPQNPVLTRDHITDAPALFVADPFMVQVDGGWFMFFEVLNWRSDKGEIGLATSADGTEWTYQQIVLAEPFHLSYPYVFEWMNEYYMIPESHQAGSVRLYKASQFPTRWSFLTSILEGPYFVDASVINFRDRWWLFVDTSIDQSHDTLRLYYADHLSGPWLEHPRSPLVEGDRRMARPGGRVLSSEKMLLRYAQDCHPYYGTRVRAFEIHDLTPTGYAEREIVLRPTIGPSGEGWNACGMHHIDARPMRDGQWMACVDGWCRRADSAGAERPPDIERGR